MSVNGWQQPRENILDSHGITNKNKQKIVDSLYAHNLSKVFFLMETRLYLPVRNVIEIRGIQIE